MLNPKLEPIQKVNISEPKPSTTMLMPISIAMPMPETLNQEENELKERMALWNLLVPTKSWDNELKQWFCSKSAKVKTVESQFNMNIALKKKSENNPPIIMSLFLLVIMMFMTYTMLNPYPLGHKTMAENFLSLPITLSFTTLFFLVIQVGLIINIYNNIQFKKFKKAHRNHRVKQILRYMHKWLKEPITLVDKPLPENKLRNAVYWQEKNERIADNFKWFNDYENTNSSLKTLIDIYPELGTLLEKCVATYPINTSQYIYLNDNHIQKDNKQLELDDVTQSALREFMTYDNQLPLEDLHVLHNATVMHKEMLASNIHEDLVKNKVHDYLHKHFHNHDVSKKIRHNELNKKQKQRHQLITEIQNALNTIVENHHYPDELFQKMKQEKIDLSELKDIKESILKYTNRLASIMKANPHIQLLKWENDYSSEQPINSIGLMLIDHLKEQEAHLVDFIAQNIEMRLK